MWRETVSGSCGTPRRLRPYAEYLPQYKFERQTLNRSMLSNDCIHSGRILPFQARALQVGSRRHRFIGKGSQPESIPLDDTGKLLLQIHVPQSHPVQARICCRSFWNSLFSFSSGVGSCDIAERERGRGRETEMPSNERSLAGFPLFLPFPLPLLCPLPAPFSVASPNILLPPNAAALACKPSAKEARAALLAGTLEIAESCCRSPSCWHLGFITVFGLVGLRVEGSGLRVFGRSHCCGFVQTPGLVEACASGFGFWGSGFRVIRIC